MPHRYDRPWTETEAPARQDVRRRHHARQAVRHHRRAVRGQEDRLAASRAARSILDLAEIERISSFGIREWVDFITAVSGKVAVAVVRRVRAQGRRPVQHGRQLRRRRAPRQLLRALPLRLLRRRSPRAWCRWRRTGKQLKTGKLPERVCESCGNAEYFDEDPLTFFSFLQSHPPVATPPDVAAFLATRLNYSADAGARKLKIEKAIDGRATYLEAVGRSRRQLPAREDRRRRRGRRHLRSRRHRQDRSGGRGRVAADDAADRGAVGAHPHRRRAGGVRRAPDQERGPRAERAHPHLRDALLVPDVPLDVGARDRRRAALGRPRSSRRRPSSSAPTAARRRRAPPRRRCSRTCLRCRGPTSPTSCKQAGQALPGGVAEEGAGGQVDQRRRHVDAADAAVGRAWRRRAEAASRG